MRERRQAREPEQPPILRRLPRLPERASEPPCAFRIPPLPSNSIR